jgi:hypothetical protein
VPIVHRILSNPTAIWGMSVKRLRRCGGHVDVTVSLARAMADAVS